MSECLEIIGGQPLNGKLEVSGAKNAVLPMMFACLLSSGKSVIKNVPNLEDVNIAIQLLESFGAEVTFARNELSVNSRELKSHEAHYSLVRALRASFWVLGPLLARFGKAKVALPGGDIIGARPVDMHLSALAQMGAETVVKHGTVHASVPSRLRGAEIDLRFPSVGATHQILMAASLAKGTTVIRNAAREPEIVALAEMLVNMGADVEGAGTSCVIVHGKDALQPAAVTSIGDRIEAGTYALAAAILPGSNVEITGFDPSHLGAFLGLLGELGLSVEVLEGRGIVVKRSQTLKALRASTGPFPNLATDLQAPLCAALGLADGLSYLEENVFEGRFSHVAELGRMGAEIQVSERALTIKGVTAYSAAVVDAHDIRGAAALVIAGLAAPGSTVVLDSQHLRRGYENLDGKLQALGAKIRYSYQDAEDLMFSGC